MIKSTVRSSHMKVFPPFRVTSRTGTAITLAASPCLRGVAHSAYHTLIDLPSTWLSAGEAVAI